MLVFRVEHPESGVGPYRHTGPLPFALDLPQGRLVGQDWDEEDPRPRPQVDVPRLGGEMKPWLVCGFASPQQLVNWFGVCLRELELAGFRLRVYEATPEGVGRYQLVFQRTAARLVDDLPVTVAPTLLVSQWGAQ